MKHTLVMMLLASLVAMAAAQTPADLIQPRTEPVQAIEPIGDRSGQCQGHRRLERQPHNLAADKHPRPGKALLR